MRFGICTLDDLSVEGKRVLLRVDINQPVDRRTGRLKDISRIEACVPTIRELSQKGARTVLLAHQGSDIEYKNYYTTRPHAEVLGRLLGTEVQFIEDVCGPAALEKIAALQPGEILLLDNVRFLAEEQTLFELKLRLSHEEQAQTLLVRKLAPLADCYVCDAFAAAHRDQPSLCGFEQLLPSAMGRLFEEEFCAVSALMEAPKRPCVFVLGGAKIADAFMMMETVLKSGSADRILTGGLVANILLWAKGEDIGGASRIFIREQNYEHFVQTAAGLLAAYADKILLPSDLAASRDGKRVTYPVGSLPNELPLVDIGEATAASYRAEIQNAGTIFVNGPMGVFENPESEHGTKSVWEALASAPGYTMVGGGDSITATNKYGYASAIDYICTAGGALIRFLTGEELPVVKALRGAAKRFVAGQAAQQ